MIEAQRSFFKYATASTAIRILESSSLRWSAPRQFNDPFDAQFDMHLDYDKDVVADRAITELQAIWRGESPLVAGNPLGQLIAAFKSMNVPLSDEALFANPEFRAAVLTGLENAERDLPALNDTLRGILRSVKVLCVSEINDSIPMWGHYGRNHTGMVLEFQHHAPTDSVWGAATPVVYSNSMPRLMDETSALALLTGKATLDKERILPAATYTKADDWAYEREWRIVLHAQNPGEDFADIAFGSAELMGLYLGCRCQEQEGRRAIGLVQERFSHAFVYAGRRADRDFRIYFEKVQL